MASGSASGWCTAAGPAGIRSMGEGRASLALLATQGRQGVSHPQSDTQGLQGKKNIYICAKTSLRCFGNSNTTTLKDVQLCNTLFVFSKADI